MEARPAANRKSSKTPGWRGFKQGQLPSFVSISCTSAPASMLLAATAKNSNAWVLAVLAGFDLKVSKAI